MKIIWYPAVSLDGFIADSSGQSSFVNERDESEFGHLVDSTGAVIVGRHTFDQYHQPNPFPKAHTYVITRNPDLLSGSDAVKYMTGGPLEVMRQLHLDGHTMATLSGGGITSGLFAAKGLIDEAWISTYPLVLGEGTPLLGNYRGSLRLSWREGFMLPGGIMHNRYDVR